MIDAQRETDRFRFGHVLQKPHHSRFSIQRLTRIPENDSPRQLGSSFNGCGWIAAYNALKILGASLPPWQIINGLEPGAVLRGYLGLSPFFLTRYLKDQGLTSRLWLLPFFCSARTVSHSIRRHLFPGGSSYLPCAIFYTITKSGAAHYICAKVLSDGTLLFYNDGYHRCEVPDTLENFLSRHRAAVLLITIQS